MFLVCACTKEETAKTKASPPPLETPKAALSSPDTIYETAYMDKERYYDTSQVKIGQDVYVSHAEAISLNDSSFVEVFSWDDYRTVHKVKQHNNLYKIKLLKNGQTVFQKQFTKHDFARMEKENPYIQGSVPRPLVFTGITTDGKVLFDVHFGLPDSDVGGIATLVTDMRGTPLLLQNYNHTGGGGCDGTLQLSENRQYYLNCQTLYGPNGYKFDFARSDVVYTSFLTDTSFVVLYDYILKSGYRMENGVKEYYEERDTIYDNLVFFHVNGKRLASDRYDGFFQELGYTAPVKLIQNSFVTLDGKKEEVTVYPFSNPSERKRISLKEAQKLSKRMKKPPVQEVFIRTLERNYFLYFFPDGLQYYSGNEHGE